MVLATLVVTAGPAAAQSGGGIYGYQSSYQLYSRAAASGGSGWRPGAGLVYPGGNVYPPPRPSVDVGVPDSGGVYGYAGAPDGSPGGYAASPAPSPAPARTPPPARPAGSRTAALATGYAEVEPDYYEEDAAPMPVYRRATGAKGVDRKFDRKLVRYTSADPAGTIIVDTGARYLYLVQGNGTAVRYGIGVGKEGFQWSGSERIARKAEWPEWRPPAEMIQRRPDLPRVMAGGEDNPLGARALYLGKTLYRIHGSNEPETIGQAVSSGCIRMRNEDIIDLYDRVNIGTLVRVI
ncbi:L,D-transpeptidase [Starkeya koreensis]|uniref:L,D-transpeptidase n=1 Tax=Ancylobacter koreensis TaxID=266121 RepID=A0ABT0DJM9_9HYPH|nr:L,D-transpeptidase [Ancylobacter koreensis]MCK0207487.1 L,D-transpeptidase [Ancylobacter koreensis]